MDIVGEGREGKFSINFGINIINTIKYTTLTVMYV
jgi:hypothetical protein